MANGPRSLLPPRYQVLRKLASDTSGDLYAARQGGRSGLSREVALKRFRGELCGDPRAARVLVEQLQGWARLGHANVLQLLDVGEDELGYYIVTEAAQGCDLRGLAESATRAGRMIPIEISISVIVQALEGLRALHRLADDDGRPLHLLHGGIGPSTVRLTYDGVVKLCDLGVAVAEAERPGDIPAVRLAYASPEAVREEPLDARSDLFSAGVLLYELTVGMRLFRAVDLAATRKAIAEPSAPPTFARAGYPADLELIVMRALERDPADRYESAGSMIHDLERFARDNGLSLSRLELGRYAARVMGVQDRFAYEPPVDAAQLRREETAKLGAPEDELDFDHQAGEPDALAVPSPPEHTVIVTADQVEGESEIEIVEQHDETTGEVLQRKPSALEKLKAEQARSDEPRADVDAETPPVADEAPGAERERAGAVEYVEEPSQVDAAGAIELTRPAGGEDAGPAAAGAEQGGPSEPSGSAWPAGGAGRRVAVPIDEDDLERVDGDRAEGEADELERVDAHPSPGDGAVEPEPAADVPQGQRIGSGEQDEDPDGGGESVAAETAARAAAGEPGASGQPRAPAEPGAGQPAPPEPSVRVVGGPSEHTMELREDDIEMDEQPGDSGGEPLELRAPGLPPPPPPPVGDAAADGAEGASDSGLVAADASDSDDGDSVDEMDDSDSRADGEAGVR